MAQTDLTEWIGDRPKIMGAMWMLVLLFAEVGPVLADAKQGP